MDQKIKAGTIFNILSLEDSPRDFEIIQELLIDSGYDLQMDRVETEKEFVSALNARTYDVILADFKLPGFNAFAALKLSIDICPDIPFICVSGSIGEETAIELIKLGAVDYVLKDRPDRLPVAIKRALDEKSAIGARRQAEEALRESEEKYRSVFEHSQDAILLTRPDGFILDANQAACEMFGRPLEEIKKLSRGGLVDANDPRLQTALEERKRTGRGRAELVFLRANGDKFHAEVTSSIFTDTEGLQKTSMIIRDMTERKQTEEELEAFAVKLWQSEQTLSAAINATNESLAMIDREGTILLLNAVAAKRLGKNLPELTGTCLYDHFSPEASALRKEQYNKVFDTGEPLYFEDKRAGRHFEQYVYPVLNERGEITRVAIFARDITKRKEAEEALREDEVRLESLVRISEYEIDTMQDLLDVALNEAIALTGSGMGYIHLYDEKTKKFTFSAWSRSVMKECAVSDLHAVYDLDSIGLWGEPVRQRRPIVFNDFSVSHPWRKGYPEGHAVIYKYLSVPVFSGSVIVAVAGVANKETDYDDSDIRQLRLLMASVWKHVERKQAQENLKASAEKLRKNLIGTIQVISMMLEIGDPYTAGHQKRVSRLARVIAQELRLTDNTIDTVRMAGTIHDIGKLAVPAEILSKPTKLTDVEFNLIKTHPQSGYDILKDVDLPHPLAEMVLQHHERLDGSGYPKGLRGEQILLEAQILAVADVVEAMASHRPYRPALGIEKALEEIQVKKGIFYHRGAVEVCLALFRENRFTFEA